jgi:arabinose-5-phosphate isomerase
MLELDIINLAKKTLKIEADAIYNCMNNNINASFYNAVQLILSCTAKLIVIGMGKSGHIGRKIAATMASTGTPSFFVHPAEAIHGDLGMLGEQDIVLMLSNSGETPEILALLPVLKRKNIAVIAITGNNNSSLAKYANVHINAAIEQEACPHNLAPTSSTTLALAIGDALAVCVLQCKNFTAEDFALSHPGGNLGRRLLINVKDIMHTGIDIPMVDINASLIDGIMEMSLKRLGMAAVVDNINDKKLIGIFTDGDLRRLLEHTSNLSGILIKDIMHVNPKSITEDKLATQALHIMEQANIMQMLVLNANNALIGAFNIQDLLRAKII